MKYVLLFVTLLTLTSCLTRVTFATPSAITVTPTSYSKEDCKSGGWQTLRRSDGSDFKNQGDCVSYFASGK
jgi:hypothetical protein